MPAGATQSGWSWDYPMVASGDMTASGIYRFVTHAGTPKRFVRSSTASGPAPIGILQGTPRSLEEAEVRILGTSLLYVNADTAITYGDYLTAASLGEGVVTTTGSSVAAIALDSVASGSMILIEVLLVPYGSGNKSDNTV